MNNAGCKDLLLVSHGFPPYYGGAEHAAGHLARYAAASGRWRVRVLTSDIGGRLPASETADGVDIVRVQTRKRRWAHHTVGELASFAWATRGYVPVPKPDFVFGHFTLPGGLVARRIARACDVPYLVTLRGSDVPGYQNARFGLLYRVVKPWVRQVWRDAALVVAVSEPLKALAAKTWPEGRIDVVPNGVDLDMFAPSDTPAPTRHNVRLTVVAQLIERKGIHHLLSAIAGLPAVLKARVRLELCGIGPYESELRRQAGALGLTDQVEFAGLVPYSELPEKLRQTDVFVLPTLQEGWPMSLLEGMASGLPALATAVGGIPDAVRHGENGMLVPPGDVPALASALRILLEDAPLRRRMGPAARAAVARCSWSAIWERYEALMDTCGEGHCLSKRITQ